MIFDYEHYLKCKAGEAKGKTMGSLYDMVQALLQTDMVEVDVVILFDRFLHDKILSKYLHAIVDYFGGVTLTQMISQGRTEYMIDRKLLKPDSRYLTVNVRYRRIGPNLHDRIAGHVIPVSIWYNDRSAMFYNRGALYETIEQFIENAKGAKR